MIKQVIVVRKNLGMRKGKIASQVAHASMGVLLNYQTMIDEKGDYVKYEFEFPNEIDDWLENSFTKIVLFVNTNEEFYELMRKLEAQEKIPYCKITDNGTTEFKGVKTDTCVAIGPDESFKIDTLTGHMQLL